jgi:hypothetical protein
VQKNTKEKEIPRKPKRKGNTKIRKSKRERNKESREKKSMMENIENMIYSEQSGL